MALDDDLLQRFYDGDLTPEEERKVRAEIAQSSAAQKRLEELSRLSELFRTLPMPAVQQLDSDAMFAGIERGIEAQKALGFGGRLRLVVSEWGEHKKGMFVPALASMAVAAAALVILLSPRHAQDLKSGTDTTEAPPLAMATLVHGSIVEDVDFGESTGTVFEVENAGVSAAVVWISDDEEDP